MSTTYESKIYESHPAALDALAKTMSGIKFDPDEYYIILTPDRYTLGIERKLFKGSGSLNCEVLTLSRLCRRVLPAGKALTREGSVMLVAKAIKNVRERLGFYCKASGFYDFARDVSETLLQLGASGLSPSEVPAAGATASKLRDLGLIADEYSRLKNDCADATDRLKDLIAAASESEFIKNSHIKAIGYADPTKLNRDVFAALARSCKSFELYEAKRQSDILPRSDGIRVFVSPDRITQYKEIATRIRNYVIDGGSYGDVSVVCSEPRALVRILGEYGVNVYAETSVTLDKTPPLVALAALYKLNEQSVDALVAFCKNPFSGCDRADAEKLQNYLTERGITYGVFKLKISDAAAARARDHAKRMNDLFRSGKNFAESVRAVEDKADFEKTHERLYGADTSMLAPLNDTLALLDGYGTGDFDDDARAFFSAARSAEVKSLPRNGDCVTVCAPSSLRMTRCKRLYVVDFNDGVLPPVTLDTGLISDSEIRSANAKIEPTAREKNARDSAELAAVINNAEYVFCSYCTCSGGRSALLAAVDTEDIPSDGNYNILKSSDDAAELARFACAPSAARELAARKLTKFSASIEKAAGETKKAKSFNNRVDEFTPKSLSASELTAWFNCPYKRFLKYTIGVTERKRGKMNAPDFGIIVHAFMQKLVDEYMTSGVMDCSESHVRELVDASLADMDIDLAADAILYERIVADARRFAVDGKTVIDRGEFKPVATECKFKDKVKLGEKGVPMNGVIDRIDVYGKYARIIDYKTYGKRFDRKHCYDGTDLQLPLYAAAVDAAALTDGTEEAGEYETVGWFYMPLRPEYNADGALLDGAFIKDVALAEAFDSGIDTGEAPPVIKARLTKSGDFNRPSANIMEKAEFEKLKNRCVETAGRAADDISSGYIERAPIEGACEYCAFGGLCPSKKFRTGGGD